jgi:phospholipase/carboxylesterase
VTNELLETLEVQTGREPKVAVIWLHGLGADGYDFEPIVPELRLRAAVRFVFPHAPVRPVTINGGMRMRAWYDIFGFGPSAPEDEDGIRDSAAAVERLVEREIERGIDSSRIVLAGFSQGGAIALYAGLRRPQPLGGILALSTYLPLNKALSAWRCEASSAVPVFMAHGISDPVIPVALADRSRRLLEGEGHVVEWRTYTVGHSVCAAEIADVSRWLAARAGD